MTPCSCRVVGLSMDRIRLLDKWEKENNYTKMIDDAIRYGIELGRKQVMDIIAEQAEDLKSARGEES